MLPLQSRFYKKYSGFCAVSLGLQQNKIYYKNQGDWSNLETFQIIL